jgi:UDP-N-acetyl-D-glucosamine dehydrogenase
VITGVRPERRPSTEPIEPTEPTELTEHRFTQNRFTHLADKIESRQATVAVVGLGYVGLPLLVAAAAERFRVIGVEADPAKVRALQEARSYVQDVSDDDLRAVQELRVTGSSVVLRGADVILIAVSTPLVEGAPDLSLVQRAAEDVAEVLRPGQLVVLESTTYPGTTEELVRPVLEGSGLKAGRDFAVAYSPERIDPGSGRSVRTTPKIVAGLTKGDSDLAALFYRQLVDEVVVTARPRDAEMAKLIENTFRQVNIALVNELATIAPALGVDIWAALEAASTKPFGYLPFWPGPGVGGHCIAIDPSYLSWRVEQRLGFGLGFVHHARSVNNRMPGYVVGRVGEALNAEGKAVKGSRVLAVGVAYKPGVPDLRESPALLVVQQLYAAGASVAFHDEAVDKLDLDGDEVESSELTPDVLAKQDCVVLLSASPSTDVAQIVRYAALVFDAQGLTRGMDADHVVRL